MSDRRNAAVYGALSRGRNARSEPQGWLLGLNAVVAQAGSVSGAARELDVPRRTLRRWLTGEGLPDPARRARVMSRASMITRRARFHPTTERRIRKAKQVTIVAEYRYDRNNRALFGPRTINFYVGSNGDTGMTAGVGDQLADAFLAGASGTDPGAGLFDVLSAAMTDDWYRDHFQDPGSHGWDVEKVIFK